MEIGEVSGMNGAMAGRVVIRQLDPLYIKEFETDPEDWESPLRYVWRLPRSGLNGIGDEVGSWEGEWIDAREILHVKVNDVWIRLARPTPHDEPSGQGEVGSAWDAEGSGAVLNEY